MFDDSPENHFNTMDTISHLCSDAAALPEFAVDDAAVQRFSSSVTFLKEWRLFNYEPRNVRFEGVNGVNLHQFSSATVPKNEELCDEDSSSREPRDFVMYTGGPIWALDWCPRFCDETLLESRSKCEFIAISAHPPGSSYHKLGSPLSGRGLVQIWCILNASETKPDIPPVAEKPAQRRKRIVVVKEIPDKVKRPRGRPRKYPIQEATVESVEVLSIEGVPPATADESNYRNQPLVPRNEDDISLSTQKVKRPRKKPLKESIAEFEGVENNDVDELDNVDDGLNHVAILAQVPGESGDIPNEGILEVGPRGCSLPDDVALPRVALCLAHNGKVAWDVKWRPCSVQHPKSEHRMGFLAVLLGDGSLEVWDIPLPHAIKFLYSSSNAEGTDPRFVKLKPVFRCSMVKSGGVQSIPLTMEWSASAPHDFILAGCHDGTVVLWKFSPSLPSKDTRPLLCFSADTAPIRAVSWAPVESDSESRNVIVTAGHEGLKFWDIRDPFRPLWDIHQAPKIVYGLDWVSDPRCLVLSFDDGTMRILSLCKAACDVPVTGKPFPGTKQQGLHSYFGSSYAIWSVQVSRPMGMVAYCGADGTVVRFQLQTKAVDKEFSRSRTPHFLCGSLTMNESCVTINTPTENTLLKPLNKSGDTPLALRDILSDPSPSKRANNNNKKKGKNSDSNDQISVDTEIEPEPEEPLSSLGRKKPSKSSSTSSEKRPENDMQLVLFEDKPKGKNGKEKEKGGKHEVLPCKDIAIHRVRWNMNKGSERWLCYGGAAGIVRCQEIVLSKIDQKLALKK